jgi:DNA-binding IclR family transcriptional regulator
VNASVTSIVVPVPQGESPMPVQGEKYFYIHSLAKGIRVMELLARQPSLSVSDVARHLGTNRAGSHRFLATLRELGYVEKDTEGRYRLTFRVLELGMKVFGQHEIHRIARPFLQELSLAFNETVNLGHFDGTDVLHLDKIDSKEILRMDSPIGSRAPAYCTALGKAILGHLPEAEREAYLQRTRLQANGPNTITSRRELRREIERARKRGYAVDNEELAPGLRCVAAPVFDHTRRPRYALSISGPTFRITSERIEDIHPKIRSVCRRLSEALGTPSD